MRIRRSLHAAWPAALLFAAACGGDGPAPDAPTSYAKDVLVDAAWLQAHAGDAAVKIVEVGGRADDFATGHLPGAVFLSMDLLSDPNHAVRGTIATREQVSAALSSIGVGRDDTVVLYDRQNNLQAARAYWALRYYGHPDLLILNGGSSKWVADGGRLTTETIEVTASTYQAGAADPAMETSWEYVVERLDDPSTITCDARSPDEYLGRDVRANRGGHIPGAVNIEWTNAVATDGTFKSAAELSALYARAGFTADRQIITYCQSGVRGAHTWFVLSELLGYPNVRNYDGSWAEWGNDPESPIES